MGDTPFPDGEKPGRHDHGAADDGFASVVFDEDFVRAAEIHEPTAVERMLAAAQSRAESDQPYPYEEGYAYRPGTEGEYGDFDEDDGRFPRSEHLRYGNRYFDPSDESDGVYGPDGYGPLRPYRGHVRWQRPVAWVLAVVMGVGVVGLALSAVYRGAVSQRQNPAPPPATSGVDPPVNGQRGTVPVRPGDGDGSGGAEEIPEPTASVGSPTP